LRGAAAEAEVLIPFRTKWDAEALRRALGPEIRTAKKSRASVRVTRRARLLTLRFLAADLVALRAMVNSFLRLAAAWNRVSVALDAQD
jgi:tRNA threonylcarbamoyladenosine modification (KEOPS) complex  Pcc1 subunit